MNIDKKSIKASWKNFYKNGYNFKIFKPYYFNTLSYEYNDLGQYIPKTTRQKNIKKIVALEAIHFWIYSAIFHDEETLNKFFPSNSIITKQIRWYIYSLLTDEAANNKFANKMGKYENIIPQCQERERFSEFFATKFECFGPQFTIDTLRFLYDKYLKGIV